MDKLLLQDYENLKEKSMQIFNENISLRNEINIYKNETVSKNKIRNKIKELQKEKKYYYSDWKIEELDSQIEVLEELLEV